MERKQFLFAFQYFVEMDILIIFQKKKLESNDLTKMKKYFGETMLKGLKKSFETI